MKEVPKQLSAGLSDYTFSRMYGQVVDSRDTYGLGTRSKKRCDDVTPKQRLERPGHGAPEVAHGEPETRDYEDWSLAEIVGHWDPEEVKRAENEDWPYQQRAGLCQGLVEFQREDIERGRETADSIIREKGEGADAGEADVFLPSWPLRWAEELAFILCASLV